MEINIYEAKTKFSQLIERAMVGEEIIIAKAGKPMVKLVRVDVPAKRALGSAAGTIEYQPGWDDPMTENDLSEMLGE